jgi:signal transduction histidine kinase
MSIGFFQSLQGKLVVASVTMVLVVLALAGFVFVWLNRGDERERKLEHVTANSSSIQIEFLQRQLYGDDAEELGQFVQSAASIYDLRALMIDASGRVVIDSDGGLSGAQLTLEPGTPPDRPMTGAGPSYIAFQPVAGSPGSDLVLIASGRTPFPAGNITIIGGIPYLLRYSLLLAVSEQTLTRAWLDLLPALGIAAGIAIPVAILLTVIVARYITRPLEQLTTASRAMASGTFDVSVSVDREDEVGRLARAFTLMADRVGQGQTRMRTLVGNISHDMKTPLTSIIGFSQALRDEEAAQGSETQRMASIIHDEAQRLNARLNDLLYLSEIESGQVVLRRDLIDVTALLRASLERLQREAEARHIAISAGVSSTSVTTDGQKLERIVENLLDNARKFTPDGGRISVRSGAGATSATAWIEVANTAEGITEEELPQLFDRFYRRDRSRNGRQAGSGLGLPIARDLATLLGGTLTASLGEGEITLRLELPPGEDETARAPAQTPQSA